MTNKDNANRLDGPSDDSPLGSETDLSRHSSSDPPADFSDGGAGVGSTSRDGAGQDGAGQDGVERGGVERGGVERDVTGRSRAGQAGNLKNDLPADAERRTAMDTQDSDPMPNGSDTMPNGSDPMPNPKPVDSDATSAENEPGKTLSAQANESEGPESVLRRMAKAGEKEAKPKRRKKQSRAREQKLAREANPGAESTGLDAAKRVRKRKKKQKKKRHQVGNQVSIAQRLLWMLDLVVFPFAATFFFLWHFFVDWASSRQGRYLLYGMPALLVGLTVVSAITYSAAFSEAKLIQRYEIVAAQAAKDEDWDAAQIYYEKLTTLKPIESRYRYRVGLVAEAQGDLARALGIMKSLAPDDRPGYSDAHLWMAVKMLENQGKNAFERSVIRPKAKEHLRLAVEADTANRLAKSLLAKMLIEEGNGREAVGLLREVADGKPLVHLQIARLERSMGNETAARQAIERAEGDLRRRLENDPANLEHWINLNAALVLRRDFQASIRLMDEAFVEVGFKKPIMEAAAFSHTLWAQTLYNRNDISRDVDEIIEHLDKALTLQPNDERALLLLTAIVESDAINSTQGDALLQDKLAEGKLPAALVHFMLGTRAATNGDLEQARIHFETAVEINNRLAPILNNLAWTYGKIAKFQNRESNLAQAESFINQAIEINPQHPRLYETRGTILMEQGKYELAIEDYLKARPFYGGKSVLFHKSMARCYREIGNDDQADANMRIAERLENAQNNPNDPLDIEVTKPGTENKASSTDDQ